MLFRGDGGCVLRASPMSLSPGPVGGCLATAVPPRLSVLMPLLQWVPALPGEFSDSHNWQHSMAPHSALWMALTVVGVCVWECVCACAWMLMHVRSAFRGYYKRICYRSIPFCQTYVVYVKSKCNRRDCKSFWCKQNLKSFWNDLLHQYSLTHDSG